MASLSSVPRRRVTVAPVGLLSISSNTSAAVTQRRNYWVYRHFRQSIASKSKHANSTQSQEGREGESNRYPYWNSSYGGLGWGWWGCSGRGEGWRAKRWAFIRGLSSGGRDGGWDSWDKRSGYSAPGVKKDSQKPQDKDNTYIDPITNRKVVRPNHDPESEGDENIKTFLSDFLSQDYQSRFLLWKEKEQKKLAERLKKEFNEQDKDLWKRQTKEEEERSKREKKRRDKEEKERKFEDELRALGKEEKQRELEREQERDTERQIRHTENSKDENKTVPHPIPVLHPYSQVPIYEKLVFDSTNLAEVSEKRKQIDRDAVAYREQKAQPGREGVEEISTTMVVEAAGEGLVNPVEEREATTSSVGVEPLNGEGLTFAQATDSPVVVLPAANKVAGEIPVTILPNLSKDVVLPEGKLGEVVPAPTVDDAPTSIESLGGGDQGLKPLQPVVTMEDAVVEPVEEVVVSASHTDGGPALVPTPPAEAPVEAPPPEEPPVAAAPPFPEPTPSRVPEPIIEKIVSPPSAVPQVSSEVSIPQSVTSELSQIKETLSQVTNVVTKLDSTMDYELNSILIQLRLWRREVEKLSSTSNSIPAEQRKFFIEDVKEIPEEKQSEVRSMDYKILTLSPTPPFHLLTTDLNVANAGAWTVEGNKDVSEFLPKLKEPYLFLQHVPKLTAEGWELVSGGSEMLMFARKSIAGQLPSLSPSEPDSNTKAIIPIPAKDATTTEVTAKHDVPTEVKTVFESSSTGYSDPEMGTGILKGDKRLIYNVNDDGHLHFYGHGLGGIAGDGVSFSSVDVHPRVNPIDMTARHELQSSSSDKPTASPNDEEERTRWDDRRTDAVRSMREGLGLGDKSQVESNAAIVEIVEDISEGNKRKEEEEARILAEIKAVDGVVHGQASLRDALAAEGGIPSAAHSEQQEKTKKKGGVGRFFKRLGWTVVWLGAGVVVVKEVGYWSQRAEEKNKVEGSDASLGADGRQQNQVGGTSSGGEERSWRGSRYSWSERERLSRGGAGAVPWSGGGSGRAWVGEERR